MHPQRQTLLHSCHCFSSSLCTCVIAWFAPSFVPYDSCIVVEWCWRKDLNLAIVSLYLTSREREREIYLSKYNPSSLALYNHKSLFISRDTIWMSKYGRKIKNELIVHMEVLYSVVKLTDGKLFKH